MSAYCYVGSAEAVCELNIGPYCINLECVPVGEPTKPYDVTLGTFNFAEWTGSPDDFWITTSTYTDGADIIDGNALLAGIEAWSSGTVAQAANGTYLGEKVYFDLCGGDGNDLITGGANWDQLYGGEGNDVLHGLGGSDQVYGDSGQDTVYGDDGNDWVDGGHGDDAVYGGAGDDNVVGGIADGPEEVDDPVDDDGVDTGADTVSGGDGNDNMYGDSDGSCNAIPTLNDSVGPYWALETIYDGNDLMDGGAGNDMMFGQGGNDTMTGGIGDDGIDGGSGNDIISGGDGIDNITGGCGNDVIKGDAGSDLINAGEGDDKVNGGTGNDWISGGPGADTLTGGAGSDHFVFCDDCGCGGDDTITDFHTAGARDQIDLTQMFNLDLVISSETGTKNGAFLELVSFGDDGICGTADDYSLGTIQLHSKQAIGRVFDLDSTFGTSSNSLVHVNAGVWIDLPSDSFVYNGELA